MSNELVSIVISCYNHEQYIEDLLESILKQTYNNIELIIADDQSPDNTFEILQRWKIKLDKRFHRVEIYQNEENLGITKSLNRLIQRAEGKYIKNVASDDILLTDAIEELVYFKQKHREYALIFGDVYLAQQDVKYNLQDEYVNNRMLGNKLKSSSICFKNLYRENKIPALGMLFSREVFEKYGLFDESIGIEDWEYWLRVSRRERIGYLNIPIAVYRINDNSITHYENSKNGEQKFVFIMNSEVSILEKYKRDAGLSANLRILKYYVFRMKRAEELNFQKAIQIIETYIKKKGTFYYRLVKLIIRVVQ